MFKIGDKVFRPELPGVSNHLTGIVISIDNDTQSMTILTDQLSKPLIFWQTNWRVIQ